MCQLSDLVADLYALRCFLSPLPSAVQLENVARDWLYKGPQLTTPIVKLDVIMLVMLKC